MSAPESHEALQVADVSHRYVHDLVLDRVSLTVRESEFLTLLGPSGCGKTTLLRIAAGFVRPAAGRVFLHGDDVTRLPAHRRPLNMVFQRAALFPHLDVFDNIAFGLRLAKLSKAEIRERVRDALALVRLDGLAHRRSDELSGGQAQRVALARALVNRPRVLLMDEPLSALDLRIRLDMEVELRRLHRQTGVTIVYVTHDQREALALSDRVAVFDKGRLQQLGTPSEIYHRPASAFAARFVGDANVLATEVTQDAGGRPQAQIAGVGVPMAENGAVVGRAWLVLRQEDLVLRQSDNGATPIGLSGTVRDVGFRGTGFAYRIEVPGMPHVLKAEMSTALGPPLAVGTRVAVDWDARAALVLPRED